MGYHHGSTFFTGLRKAGQSTRQRMHQHQQDGQHQHQHQAPGSSPPWFPGADHHLWQWARHRAQTSRRDSGSYTFTDLAQMVVQNLSSRDAASEALSGPVTASSPYRSRAGSHASSTKGSTASGARRRRFRSGESNHGAEGAAGSVAATTSSSSRRRFRSGESTDGRPHPHQAVALLGGPAPPSLQRSNSGLQRTASSSKIRRATVGLRPQNQPQLYYVPSEDDSDDTGIVM